MKITAYGQITFPSTAPSGFHYDTIMESMATYPPAAPFHLPPFTVLLPRYSPPFLRYEPPSDSPEPPSDSPVGDFLPTPATNPDPPPND